MDKQDKRDWGRRIFFLYPHPSIREMLPSLIRMGYEAYLLDDHTLLMKLLVKYKNALVFINIDQALKEKEWEHYIKNIQADAASKEVKVGILSYFKKESAVIQKYLMEVGIQCGFVSIDLNPENNMHLIVKILEANEARGQRRYVRAICNKKLDTFNTMHNGMRTEGYILNLSLAGMACVFKRAPLDITPKTYLKNIQLILRGARCSVSGIVMDTRKNEQGEDIFIIIFNIKAMEQQMKEKIYNFISYCIQQKMQEEIYEIRKSEAKTNQMARESQQKESQQKEPQQKAPGQEEKKQ